MHKCYHQLAYDERCQIGVLLSQGFSMRGIASGLNRSPATISREIACNRGGCGYRHGQAQAMASARGSEASGVPRKLTEALWRRITGLLGQGWSPEQVEGRLKRLGEETVGREWICRQVLQPRQQGRNVVAGLRVQLDVLNPDLADFHPGILHLPHFTASQNAEDWRRSATITGFPRFSGRITRKFPVHANLQFMKT